MEKSAVIPPDALYATTMKKIQPNLQQQQNRNSFYQQHQGQQSPSSYAYDPSSFNDSKVRIHTFSRKQHHMPILNNSSLNHQPQQQQQMIANHYVTTSSMNQSGYN